MEGFTLIPPEYPVAPKMTWPFFFLVSESRSRKMTSPVAYLDRSLSLMVLKTLAVRSERYFMRSPLEKSSMF